MSVLQEATSWRARWLARRNGVAVANRAREPAAVPAKLAFEAATLPHADALYRTAYHLSRNHAEAEDLTQETFLRAYRAYDGYRGGNIRSWLFAILRHAFIDERRRLGRQGEVEFGDAGPEIGGVWQPSAESEALRRLPSEALERAFSALPPDWRMMVILADVEEFTYREIADVMGIPIGTVMSRLHRARARLRDHLLTAPRVSWRSDGRSA